MPVTSLGPYVGQAYGPFLDMNLPELILIFDKVSS